MKLDELIKAAQAADWGQVVSNGGPPCFVVEDGRFCLRAQRWAGHPIYHKFIDLPELIRMANKASK